MAMSIKSSVICASQGTSFAVGIRASVSTISIPELSVADFQRYTYPSFLLRVYHKRR